MLSIPSRLHTTRRRAAASRHDEARRAEPGRHEREHESEHVLDDLVLRLLLRRAQRVDLAVEPEILVWAVVGNQ